MEPDPKTLCDNCIHDDICGMECHLEPALKYCANKISADTLSLFQKPLVVLRLSDLIPYLRGSWFTIIRKTGETNNNCTYTYPEDFRVISIEYDEAERKIAVVVEEI